MTPPRDRAAPMAVEDRRRAIAEAVIPLLSESGAAVTSRRIAEAAGVAEGTIFRVFPDKYAVIRHAFEVMMDPRMELEALEGIDRDAPLEDQLQQAIDVLMRRQERIVTVLGVLRNLPGTDHAEHRPGPPAALLEANAAITEALGELFSRHRSALAVEPGRAAVILRGLMLASAHLQLCGERGLAPEEISTVLRRGLLEAAG